MTNASSIKRRQFLAGAAGVAGAAAFGPQRSSASISVLPDPGASGIDHIVVVMMMMMENRSFDHYLGWLPGADGQQAGLTYLDSTGMRHHTYHLSDYQGCNHPDPDHSYEGGRVEYDGGRCDG